MPLIGTDSLRRSLRLASTVLAAALVVTVPVVAAPAAGTITATVTAMNALLNPAPSPPVKEWVTVAEASAAKPAGPVVTVTGKLHIEYTFTGQPSSISNP